MRFKIIILSVMVSVLSPCIALAFEGIDFYAAPAIGYTWYQFKSMEIEQSFVRKNPDADESDTNIDITNLDNQPVGSKASFDGSGITLGISAGIEIFNLSLGLRYSWASVSLEGYTKQYSYIAELNRARGEKEKEGASIDAQRVLFEIGYGITIGLMDIVLNTRIGSLIIDPGDLSLGRAASEGNGFTGDLGMRLDFYPLRFLGISLDGWFGFFSFTGNYEGTFGTTGGINALVIFKI